MKHILYIIFAAILLLSCSASKNLASGTAATSQEAEKEVVTARVAIEMQNEDFSPTGRLRMQRDEVIQLNLVMMGMNIATLEFTPDSVLIIDRFNKQYVQTRYDKIHVLREQGINFSTLQSLFWGDDIRGKEEPMYSWKYTAIGRVNKHKIPSTHEVRFKAGEHQGGFDMTLTDFGNDKKWERRTTVDKEKYTYRDANVLFNVLMNL